jgi:phosphatidylserine/phosphatidylglycerophosphate/cardiolipin synthase-like enzyme
MEVITDAPRDIHTIFSAHANSGSAADMTLPPSRRVSFSLEESRVVSFSDVFAELAPAESTLEVRSEGNFEGFAPAVDQGTLVGTITVTPQEDDVSATLAIAPVVPRVEYFVGIPGVTPGAPGTRAKATRPAPSGDLMHVPRFTPLEHAVHKTIFARLLARRVALKAAQRLLPKRAFKAATFGACECAGRFLPSVYRVENEAFEMMMLRKVRKHVDTVDVAEWNQKYMGEGKCVWPVRDFATDQSMRKMGFPPAPACDVRLMGGFKEHVGCVETAVQRARGSIAIATCYFKADEAHFTRLLCELLPAAARRGVRVRMLLDATVARAAIARSNGWGPLTPYASQADARAKFLDFYDNTLQKVIKQCPPGSFRVGFFQATEPVAGYEVKSHVKLFAVDGDFAVTGGSNLYPTELTQKSDCDIAVNGAAARAIDALFNEMWLEQTGERLEQVEVEVAEEKRVSKPEPATPDVCDVSVAVASFVPESVVSSRRVNLMSPLGWHAHGVRFHPVMSRPDRTGEDAVLRAVVGLADKAEREFLLCMGFAAPHAPLIDALRRATARGVRVRVLLNSQYSADLQTPMGDLAAGARAMLVGAPKVELYLTGPKKSQRADIGKGVHAFQHGKFCVADRHFCSVGSWNAWARSAFHEMELNMFFDAPDLAEKLAEKWARAAAECARVKDPAALTPGTGRFAPLGCEMCAPFGKFTENALACAREWASDAACAPCQAL